MPISKKDVVHAAELARLALTEEEVQVYTKQIQRILEHIEKLSGVQTIGVLPTTYTAALTKLRREDKTIPSLSQHDALMNAPEKAKGCIKVPKIIE